MRRSVPSAEGRTAWFNRQTAVISLITALVVAASTLAPTVPKINDLTDTETSLRNENAAFGNEIESLRGELASTSAALESREETIEALRSENSDLRTLVPPEIDPQEAHEIRKAGTVTLAAEGDVIDLNSTLDNFGADDGYPSQDSLYYDGETLEGGYGMSYLDLKDTAASYEACAAASGYRDQTSYEPHRLKDGTVCLRLTSDRYVKVVVKRYDQNAVVTAITVWE